MIWGSTYAEKHERRLRFWKWHPWYAWYPVRLVCGRWAWLEKIERRGDAVLGAFGEYVPYASYRGAEDD